MKKIESLDRTPHLASFRIYSKPQVPLGQPPRFRKVPQHQTPLRILFHSVFRLTFDKLALQISSHAFPLLQYPHRYIFSLLARMDSNEAECKKSQCTSPTKSTTIGDDRKQRKKARLYGYCFKNTMGCEVFGSGHMFFYELGLTFLNTPHVLNFFEIGITAIRYKQFY